jgi:hypothetical protein
MISESFCPVCKNKNAANALLCSFCGALLDGNATSAVAVTEHVSKQPAVSAQDVAAFINTALIPEGGLGIYIAGAPKPYYVPVDKELIIGRETDATLEAVLDLTALDTFNMGLSRRHAMIRRTDAGFEVLDLGSRNGTWLNAGQLTPNKPYPFASGSQLRLGRLRLFVVYQVTGRGTPKS